jgi:hypothetical protein
LKVQLSQASNEARYDSYTSERNAGVWSYLTCILCSLFVQLIKLN